MKKIIILVMLSMSILYSNEIIVSDMFQVNGLPLRNVTIQGNSEECTLTYQAKMNKNNVGLENTDCIKITNSKGVEIFCTKNKKICKTDSEIQTALDNSINTPTSRETESMYFTRYESGHNQILIKAKSEDCALYFDENNQFMNTDCLTFANSQGVDIACTKKKKMCKTQNEVMVFLNENRRQPNTYQTNQRSGQVNQRSHQGSLAGTYDCTMIGKLVLKESGTAKIRFGTESIGWWKDDGDDGQGGREAMVYVDYGAESSPPYTFVRKRNGEYKFNRFFPCEKVR